MGIPWLGAHIAALCIAFDKKNAEQQAKNIFTSANLWNSLSWLGAHSHRAALFMTMWHLYPLTMQSVMATPDQHPSKSEPMALTVTGLHYASQHDFCIHGQCSLSWLPQINVQADRNSWHSQSLGCIMHHNMTSVSTDNAVCHDYPRSTPKQIGIMVLIVTRLQYAWQCDSCIHRQCSSVMATPDQHPSRLEMSYERNQCADLMWT